MGMHFRADRRARQSLRHPAADGHAEAPAPAIALEHSWCAASMRYRRLNAGGEGRGNGEGEDEERRKQRAKDVKGGMPSRKRGEKEPDGTPRPSFSSHFSFSRSQ